MTYILYPCIYLGMDDVHCDVYSVTFNGGSNMENVEIPLVNDDIPECDETFKAHIIILGEGFRLGEIPSTDITIKDEGKVDVPMVLFWS